MMNKPSLSRKQILGIILSWVLFYPLHSLAAETCADLASPPSFTPESAMLAIFCAYNQDHEGTLVPLTRTTDWDVMHAETLATPLFVATYREKEQEKGVLVVARQMLEDGEPYVSHAQGAALSAYVFRYQDSEWVYEKGKKYVVDNAGSFGQPPAVRLMRLGSNKYGLLFRAGYCNMGECSGSAFIVPVSESAFDVIADFEMSGNNEGSEQAHWAFEGRLEGVENGTDDYLLRIVFEGTEHDFGPDGGRIVPKSSPQCYKKGPEKYERMNETLCSTGSAVLETVLFPGGK